MQPRAIARGVIAADDSIIVRDIVRTALGQSWRVFVAKDGAEAVDYARRLPAELVLLDLRMPRMDGMEACALIRALPCYRTVPIVLLTAYDDSAVRRQAETAGFTAVLAKPFSAASLLAWALNLIEPARAEWPQDAITRSGYSLPQPSVSADALSADHDVLAVHREVEAAARQRRDESVAEFMAAWRAQARG